MRKAKEIAGRKCPLCGKTEHQVNAGKNRSGTQRCFCNDCKKYYTLEPKTREYPEEIRKQAIKTYYAGASGRGVGKVFGFNKAKEALDKSWHASCLHIFRHFARKLLEIHQVFLRHFHAI